MGIDVYVKRGDKRKFDKFALACNTTDHTFGPVFWGTEKDAEAFIQWCPKDPRHYKDGELEDLYAVFIKHFNKEVKA